jgi:DNA repair exonuclease SbcCD ATPase subunit
MNLFTLQAIEFEFNEILASEIRNECKSLGIISHVGELKDRIGAKIKLVKTGIGYSALQVE